MPFYPWGESVDPDRPKRVRCPECKGTGELHLLDEGGKVWTRDCDCENGWVDERR